MPPKIIFWKWTEEELAEDGWLPRARDLCTRTGFDLVLVGSTDCDRRLDDPALLDALRNAVRYFGEHGRRVAFCLDPRDEKERYLERGMPTLGFVDATACRLDGETWRSEVPTFPHRFAEHTPEAEGPLAVFALDPIERLEPRGYRAGPGWCEVDLPDVGRDGVCYVLYRLVLPDVFSPEVFELQQQLFERFADVGLGGVMLDEWGTTMHPGFDFSRAWTRPWYSPHLAAAYRERTGRDFVDDLPHHFQGRRTRAYYDLIRERTVAFEQLTYDLTKKHIGPEAFVGAHPTWWGLDDDHQAFELWKNGFNWWDVPRDYAQTDEVVAMGVRLSLARSAGRLPWYNMWYSFTDPASYYEESWRNARYGGRTHYLGYRSAQMAPAEILDGCWALEERLTPLDGFLGSFPDSQVLLVVDHDAVCSHDNVRDGVWSFGDDALGSALRILKRLWDVDYLAELIPSYTEPQKEYPLVLHIDGSEDPEAILGRVDESLARRNDVPYGVRYEDGSVVCTAEGREPVGNRFRTTFRMGTDTVTVEAEDYFALNADGDHVAGHLDSLEIG